MLKITAKVEVGGNLVAVEDGEIASAKTIF